MQTILIQAAAIFLQVIIRDAPGIIERAVGKAGELQCTEGMTSTERCRELKKWLKGEIPSARSYMINLIVEVSVAILKQNVV